MSPTPFCRCPICRLHDRLLHRLNLPDGVVWYQELAAKHSALAPFPAILDLAAFIRDTQKAQAGRSLEDRIYTVLIQDLHEGLVLGLAETLFVFLFLYPLHSVSRNISRAYPVLDPEDVAQQSLVFFLHVIRSPDLQNRTEFLGRAIVERTNRNTFRWAIPASRVVLEEPLSPAKPADPLLREHDPRLLYSHFLARAMRDGWLSASEADLLERYEIANISGSELGKRIGVTANAIEIRIRRLLVRLRKKLRDIRKNGGRFLPS